MLICSVSSSYFKHNYYEYNRNQKALYKQKPTAIRTNYQGEYVHYVTQLEDASIIQFEIPNQEATFGN